MQVITARESKSILAALHPQRFFHVPCLPTHLQLCQGQRRTILPHSALPRESRKSLSAGAACTTPTISPTPFSHWLIQRPFLSGSPSLMMKYVVEGVVGRAEQRKAHHPSAQPWQLITQLVKQGGEGRGPPERRRGARGKGQLEDEVVRRGTSLSF